MDQRVESSPDNSPQFANTRWSLVLRASQEEPSSDQEAAMETLCRQYWYPLYYFVRREGQSPEAAKDIVQGFFAHLLERNALAQADASRGRFRSFLIASVSNFTINENRKQKAKKRGGDVQAFLSLDEAEAEGRYLQEPVDERTPDQAFAKRWAETVLQCSLTKLRDELDVSGKRERFDVLKPYLLHQADTGYREAATELKTSENAVRSMIHRMRQRFHMIFREEISHTVDSPLEVDDEIRFLLNALQQ